MALMLQARLRTSLPALSRAYWNRCRIGNRDVVGYGINGGYNYSDDAAFPFPAVRFRENSTEIAALREKEKGDWHNLSIDEKKCLYRSSFCQTFAEFQHPTGEWKYIVGWSLFFIGCAMWMRIFVCNFVCDPLPQSFCEESRKAQLRRMLDLRVNPIDGLSSKWDYKNDKWK